MNNKSQIFLEYKSLLFSIAYNMLGNVEAAEDIVQDTFVKWLEMEDGQVQYLKAYLVKSVTNRCINYMNSARNQREEYKGIWLPEPLNSGYDNSFFAKIESYHALSIGFLVLLEKLSPNERAIFLLREIFAYDYAELAEIFDRSEDSCRQLLKRAKDNLGKDSRRFQIDFKVHEKILNSFLMAISEGNLGELIQVLKEDIVLFAEGGTAPFMVNGQRLTAFSKPIYGRSKVSKLLLTFLQKVDRSLPNVHREVIMANGLPSVISYLGNKVMALISIEPGDDQVKHIFVQTNPEKLKRFQRTVS